MKTIINKRRGEPYSDETDILFRCYPNQTKLYKVRDFCDDWYCFEVFTRNDAYSKYAWRQYTSAHPQAIQYLIELLLDEQKDNDVTIEFSNELINGQPHIDCNDMDWVDVAIEKAIAGRRRYPNVDDVNFTGRSSRPPYIDSDYHARCPSCKSYLISRYNPKTKKFFVGCSDYPRCKYTHWNDRYAVNGIYFDDNANTFKNIPIAEIELPTPVVEREYWKYEEKEKHEFVFGWC